MKFSFSKEFMCEVLDGENKTKIIEDKITGNGRWNIFHNLIWQHIDGRVFQCQYSVGATETQEESPWEYEKEIECTEMVKRLITTEKWIPKE